MASQSFDHRWTHRCTRIREINLNLLRGFAPWREKFSQWLTQRRKAAKKTEGMKARINGRFNNENSTPQNLPSLLLVLSVSICVHLWLITLRGKRLSATHKSEARFTTRGAKPARLNFVIDVHFLLGAGGLCEHDGRFFSSLKVGVA